jgi:hypothetical protein
VPEESKECKDVPVVGAPVNELNVGFPLSLFVISLSISAAEKLKKSGDTES